MNESCLTKTTPKLDSQLMGKKFDRWVRPRVRQWTKGALETVCCLAALCSQ
jgi:hypothetical protein